MDTLDGTDWDVVISGTGFAQSLLALSLSRSSVKVLHLDQNDYYGGPEAALSLSDAEDWAVKHSGQGGESTEPNTFTHAAVTTPSRPHEVDGDIAKLAASRAYSLALAPQLVYARSNIVPALVSAHTHAQLEFQAVGSSFTVSDTSGQPILTRVPSGREAVFADHTLDLRAKRSLMKFLRFVSTYEDTEDEWRDMKHASFSSVLEQKFSLPPASHTPLLALTLSPHSPEETTLETALPAIARHLRSIGVFGPGFAAVLPKWGGLAEIAQVACRACAVGGGVYVLNKGIKSCTQLSSSTVSTLELSGGEKVTTRWLVGGRQDLPQSNAGSTTAGPATSIVTRSVSIVSSPLEGLFPLTSEGGVTPAGAVVVVPSSDSSSPPVHILVHSTDSGECPTGQCVLYASVALPHSLGIIRLDESVKNLLQSMGQRPVPEFLWRLTYQQQVWNRPIESTDEHLITLPDLSANLALEDAVLSGVKKAWLITTGDNEDNFMNFNAREGMGDDDE